MASITGQLKAQDTAFADLLNQGGPALDEGRALFDRVAPALPVLLANMVSLGEIAVTYRADIEQLLVLFPQGTAVMSAIVAGRTPNTKQDYKGVYLDFNLNLNLPPPCNTGFLPVRQQRSASDVDYPERPAGELYCRVPQDSDLNVRGVRNIPCEGNPAKRAPTVEMCESNEQYVPLNDGYNWKGDPNATLSGQGVPQYAPARIPACHRPRGRGPPCRRVHRHHRMLRRRPARHRSRSRPTTRRPVTTSGPTAVATRRPTSRLRQDKSWQSMLIPPES